LPGNFRTRVEFAILPLWDFGRENLQPVRSYAPALDAAPVPRTCGSPDSNATRDNQLGRQALHNLVLLIACQASHHGDPSIWPGSRGPDFQDFTFDLQTVTGPGWIWPIKFTASPYDTAGEWQAALDQEAHSDRSRVPTACHQARKQGALSSLDIKVERLRIELTGKSFDLILINDVGSAREALPDLEIIEIEPIVVAEFLHGRCLQSPPPLERAMQIIADRPEAPSTIRSDLGAIFISLELSRSTWLITSLSPGGGEKMSKHIVPGGDICVLLARPTVLQTVKVTVPR
jgi:hypothetical protein